ncbi:hypothetical protein [Pelagicoccus sp. SDUM812005]|uniref:hypothetical protein n=1 Tax=Pelagicoccus sp. SDUM812005 TaxID=3041257 RepID=UPI00280ED07E|nr:hypothetical protein [Pelagicoccus sp. SDUM812005]MDQ8183847.1 hypothetical protein [Pelagicoccus sp. SDUM812005]
MNPIATYKERRHEGKRDFELYPDRLIITGKNYLSADFKSDIPLDNIRPEKEIVSGRNSTFKAGLAFPVMAYAGWRIMVDGFNIDSYAEGPMLMWVLALVGVVMILTGIRKEEYTCFKSDAGVTVLNIARNRKGEREFEEFVSKLENQLKKQDKKGEIG